VRPSQQPIAHPRLLAPTDPRPVGGRKTGHRAPIWVYTGWDYRRLVEAAMQGEAMDLLWLKDWLTPLGAAVGTLLGAINSTAEWKRRRREKIRLRTEADAPWRLELAPAGGRETGPGHFLASAS
jgi:hypothetical protein